MTHLYLIRHGRYIREADGRLVDHRLTSVGVRQAELLRDRLATGEIKADVLVASTLPRARHTAEIIAPALGLPVQFDADFEEWRNNDGSLSMEEFNEMWSEVPQDQIPYHHWITGCENWLEFQLRATSAFNRLLLEHAGKTIVLVCHGGIIDMSFVYFFGLGRFSFPKATTEARHTAITSWKEVDFPGFPAVWTLQSYNDDRHLAGMVFKDGESIS
ncbi:MAG: histidine phosphatase family protein [Ktedonobacteraceae bacterium]